MARPANERWKDDPLRAQLQPELDEPEDIRPRKGKLRRIVSATPVMMSFVVLLLVAVGALSWYAMKWKRQVTVNRIVISGTSLIPQSTIERRLKGFMGRNLDEVLIDDVRHALISEPYIREMQIGKELNGILRVRIEERRPAAIFADENRSMIIDTEGNLLPGEGVSQRFRLVPVYGARSTGSVQSGGVRQLNATDRNLLFALLDAFEESAYVRMLVSGIDLARDNGTWFTVAGSPIRFVVGNDGNFKEKLKKFEIFWQKVVAKKGLDCYESVDLRFRERVFATPPQIETELADSTAATPMPQAATKIPDEHH